MHRACSSAANKLGKIANKVPSIKSAERMVTPEGMHFNAADNNFSKTNKNLGGSSTTATAKKIITANNMQDFFANTKFGQLLKGYLEKTKKSYQTKAIYRVKKDLPEYGLTKGDQLYLDNLHKDHLEVFNKNGRCITVLNLDGIENIDKALKARGRRLYD